MLRKRFPDKSTSELIKHTQSYRYTETFVEQIGKKIKIVEVPIEPRFNKARRHFTSEQLRPYGLTSQDEIAGFISEINFYFSGFGNLTK